MSINTVLGSIDSNELGITLPHEHIFIDLRNQFSKPEEVSKRMLSEQEVNIQNLGVLRRNPYAVKDNLLLADPEVAENELMKAKEVGARTVVDATTVGIGRDSRLLKRIALNTGLNIIAGSGYYTYDTHPEDMDEKTVEEITDEIVNDLTRGVKNTGIKAGVIGELGTSEKIYPNEEKVLFAGAKAHHETGAPILVHIFPWSDNGREVLDIFSEEGVEMDKVAICHSDVPLDIEYMKDILSRGAMLEFDNFGKEFYIPPPERDFAGGIFATDIERVRTLKLLLEEGYKDQILISNDICLKILLHRYGGWGYDHVLQNIVTMMVEEGIDRDLIGHLIEKNPKEWLNPAKSI